jgi:hypothetical protein
VKPRLAALILLACPAIAVAAALANGPAVPRWAFRVAGPSQRVGPPPAQAPGRWFVVDPQADAMTAGVTPWAVGFPGQIPRLLHHGELDLPSDHPLSRIPYTLIVESVVAPSGRIARARILRGPDTPSVRTAIADDLKGWLYVPAMLDGKAVSVCQVLAVRTAVITARSPAPQAIPRQ